MPKAYSNSVFQKFLQPQICNIVLVFLFSKSLTSNTCISACLWPLIHFLVFFTCLATLDGSDFISVSTKQGISGRSFRPPEFQFVICFHCFCYFFVIPIFHLLVVRNSFTILVVQYIPKLRLKNAITCYNASVENSAFFAAYVGLRRRFMTLAGRPTTTAILLLVVICNGSNGSNISRLRGE